MSDDHPQRVCATCRWWVEIDPDDTDDREGWCKRYPPQFNVRVAAANGEDAQNACFPVTDPEDFCGEWQPARGYCEHEWTVSASYGPAGETIRRTCSLCGARHEGNDPPEVGERGAETGD